ncbi:ABC transporter ATP-binding protein [uncultured Mameliella sp.]|uniref:ABC transporter transmembrane domain-containing protein n=1 Tax=uncultured Mameliella sp. TaxID=1447087 RepID=UPI002625A687|nr:ABC transporter ATP-binding protein [uncultured Mameliella sp.]
MTLRHRLSDMMIRRAFFGADWLTPVMARALPSTAMVLVLSLLAAGAGLAAPMITKAVIDQGIMGGDMRALLFWAAVSFAVGLGVVALGIFNGMQHLRASMRMLGDLRMTILGCALNRNSAMPALTVGEIQTRIDGDTAEIQKFLFDSVLVAVTALFRLAGGIVLMFLLDWRLALLPLLAAPFEMWFLSWARPGTQARAESVRTERGGLNGQLAESFMQVSGLRALGALETRVHGFGRQQSALFDAQARQKLWTEGVSAVGQLLTAVMRSVVLLVGGWLVIRGDWQIGSLVAFLAYATMMSGPLRNLLGLYHAQARARVALDRLDAVVRNATEPDTGAACPDRFERLTFVEARGPDGAHAPLTATLDAGDRVLLDGRSGIGKSRLLAAIIGESPLAEGRIEIDGANVEGFSPSSLRRVITFLPQRPCLIRGTLRDNLRLGNDGPDDAALWRVLGVVGLADWAQGLDGLDTDLQETGCNLSGGMLQRITLARALLRSSQVYIFDESLSEIDADCCRTILSAIDTYLGDAICVFVAHAGPVRAMTFDRTLRLSAEESGAAFPESPARFVQAI